MNVIIADRHELTVSSSVEIEILKEQALAKAALINKVESPEQDQEVTRVAAELKAVQKAIEDSRVSAKEPFLDIGRRIDAKAKELRKDLDEELLRVNRILGDYAQLKLAQQRAADNARMADMQEAERKRQNAIAAAENLEQIEAINHEFNQRNAEICATAPPDKTKGQSVREDWEFEVFDIHAAYRSHPAAFKLTPLATEIKAILDATGGRMAGVRAKKAAKVSVRAAAPGKLIEV